MEFAGASHQAHQIDLNHLAKPGHFEFAAAVDHRALRQHQHVQPVERWLEILDCVGVADIELRVFETLEARSLSWRIIGGGSAGAADMDLRAMGAERLCNAVADPAGAADHQNPLAAKIQFVHRQPRIWFYAENITANIPGKKRMSDFKQLSRSVRGLTVLVTGAASGMGRATARVFAAEGANVAVTDHAAEGAKTVAAEITAEGEVAKAWTLDVADRDQITAVVSDVAAHFGGLDIIVNNAGMSVHTKIDEEGNRNRRGSSISLLPRRSAPPQSLAPIRRRRRAWSG